MESFDKFRYGAIAMLVIVGVAMIASAYIMPYIKDKTLSEPKQNSDEKPYIEYYRQFIEQDRIAHSYFISKNSAENKS